jgi:hypothetical protein
MRFQASSGSEGVIAESGDGMEQPLEVDGEKFENIGEMDVSRAGENAGRALGAWRWKPSSPNSDGMSSAGGGKNLTTIHEKGDGQAYECHVAGGGAGYQCFERVRR